MKYVRIVNESVHSLAFCLNPRMPVTAFVFLYAVNASKNILSDYFHSLIFSASPGNT